MPMDGQKMKKTKYLITEIGKAPLKRNQINGKTANKGTFAKVKYWLEKSRDLIASLLFPARCVVCDEILAPEELKKGIHLACENKLFPVEGAVCMHCGRPLGQIHARETKQHRNINKDTYVKDEKELPMYLRMESNYEYCRECTRKGYVSVIGNDIYQKRRKYSKENIGDAEKSNITQAKSMYLYKGEIKKTMYRFKYANKREYAGYFAQKAVEKYGEWLHALAIDVIVPVPMYAKKQRQRGYNQAECFAEELSKRTGIPVHKNYIRRVKDTTPQKNLKDIERKNNLENAFQKTENIVQYNHVLVVDDIYTTGYTAEAIAKELKKGSHHIYLLSICIGGNH